MSHLMRAASLLLAICTAGTAAAQNIQVPGPTLTAGSTTQVSVYDPSQAGQQVTVTVDNGSLTNPKSQTVKVTLDESGNGTAPWQVPAEPGWYFAFFKYDGATGLQRPIVEPPDPDDTSDPAAVEPAPSADASAVTVE